jgi:eukaryotic-like serine/threonine-protein kinase
MADRVIAGRYRLEERIGGGATSDVWSATDLDLDRRVAVKLLAPNADPARFEREARAVASLGHPNICTLYAYGEIEGRPYIVLEYLPGGSLEDRLTPGRPLADEETHRIAAEIAAGLAHAHARHLVHRDLKPANVLFDGEGRAKIADFGIARIGDGSGLTATGTVFGTAAYISPEQAAGETATEASDVYAFGVVLFRMLTGRLPFESDDALAVAAMHRDETPPAVAAFRPDAPARLESMAAAALTKSPADRPRDGSALLAELAGPLRQSGEETAVTQIIAPPPRGRSRTAIVVTAAAAAAAAGVGLAIAVTFGGSAAKTPPSTSTSTTRPAPVVRPTVASTSTTTTAPSTTARTTTETTPPATLPATTAPTTTTPTTTAATTTTAPPPSTTTAPPPTTTATTTTAATTTTTTTTPTTTTATTTVTTPAQPG